MRKLCDVYIEAIEGDRSFILWADEGKEEKISQIEGVHHVFADGAKYHVFLDPRYDQAEVERAIIKAVAGTCCQITKKKPRQIERINKNEKTA